MFAQTGSDGLMYSHTTDSREAFLSNLQATTVVQFQLYQIAAWEEPLGIFGCRNNGSLRKGKKDVVYESLWERLWSSGKGPYRSHAPY